MKRYIRASFDTSMPTWLKDKFTSSRYPNYAESFVNKYGVALADAKFTTSPTGRSLAIYNLLSDRGGRKIYIPGINDDEKMDINGRYRTLGSIAKSKLPELATDIVYVDLDANRVSKDAKYRDPRYIYDGNDKKGRYGGQKYSDYDDKWKTQTARNERHSRDKSGYEVPSPESQLQRYYTLFPEKLTNKVDALYQRILEVKDKVLAPEVINTPYDSSANNDIGNAIYRLRDAIDEYRNILADLKKYEDSKGSVEIDEWRIKGLASRIKLVSNRLDEAEYKLTHKW